MKLNRPYPLDAPEIGAASACRVAANTAMQVKRPASVIYELDAKQRRRYRRIDEHVPLSLNLPCPA